MSTPLAASLFTLQLQLPHCFPGSDQIWPGTLLGSAHISARKVLETCIITHLTLLFEPRNDTNMSGVKKFMHKIKEKMESVGEGHHQDNQGHTEKVGAG